MARADHRVGRLDVRHVRGTDFQHYPQRHAHRHPAGGARCSRSATVGRRIPRRVFGRWRIRWDFVRFAGRSLGAQADHGGDNPVLFRVCRADVFRDVALAGRRVAVSRRDGRRRRVGRGGGAGSGGLSETCPGARVGDFSRDQHIWYLDSSGGGARGRGAMALCVSGQRAAGDARVMGLVQREGIG